MIESLVITILLLNIDFSGFVFHNMREIIFTNYYLVMLIFLIEYFQVSVSSILYMSLTLNIN